VPTFPAIVTSVPTGASELLRNNLQDILDFLTDFNTLTKLKVYSKNIIYLNILYYKCKSINMSRVDVQHPKKELMRIRLEVL